MLSTRLVAVLLTTLLLAAGTASAAWSIQPLTTDTEPPVTDIAVGDGDRDGKPEVYAATNFGVLQLRKTSGGWSTVHIGDGRHTSIAVGDGTRDGQVEVFAGGRYDGNITRYFRSASCACWKSQHVASLGESDFGEGVETLTLGDADRNGNRELYAGNGTGAVFKVWYDGAWKKSLIADLGATAYASWIGDGDRDGSIELYMGTDAGGVWRLRKASSGWNVTLIASLGGDVQGVATGDGDNSGKVEVYATSYDGNLYKVHKASAGWQATAIAGTNGTLPTDVVIADVDGLSGRELYTTGLDGHVYRVRSVGGDWVTTDLGTVPDEDASLYTVAAGDADRDGDKELYVGSQAWDVKSGRGAAWKFEA